MAERLEKMAETTANQLIGFEGLKTAKTKTGNARMSTPSVEKQRFTHLRVELTDGERIRTGQFTLFDLVDRCFSFSQKRKQLAVQVLGLLAEKPRTFTSLLAETQASKSSLHLTLSALEQSGLVLQDRRGAVFELSDGFVGALLKYAGFWQKWKKGKEGTSFDGQETCLMDEEPGQGSQNH